VHIHVKGDLMISQALLAGTPAPAPGPAAGKPSVVLPPGLNPEGSFIDVVMLQLHVIMATTWLILAVIVALMSVPKLRRIPSALGLHTLQVHRATVTSALWGLYLMSLSTGTYLLFQQAAYDPPLSGDEWNRLDEMPYALPYYYALYGKIILFAVMGLASYVLSREAKRASKESEASGGPKEQDLFIDDSVYEDYDDGYYGSGRGGTRLRTYAQTTAIAKAKSPTRSVHVVPLWISIGVMILGTVGIAFCVTLIKYFHELSKAAVVYEILKNIPSLT
jgi:hypothetical protein